MRIPISLYNCISNFDPRPSLTTHEIITKLAPHENYNTCMNGRPGNEAAVYAQSFPLIV